MRKSMTWSLTIQHYMKKEGKEIFLIERLPDRYQTVGTVGGVRTSDYSKTARTVSVFLKGESLPIMKCLMEERREQDLNDFLGYRTGFSSTVQTPAAVPHCEECWGTGFISGWGGPCSRGCGSKTKEKV